MWLFFLALSAVGNGGSTGGPRHRVTPNQQVWEQIRGNMERKNSAVVKTAAAAKDPKVPVAASASKETMGDMEEEVLKVLKPKKRGVARKSHIGGPKFLQYNGKHPVGRHQKRPQAPPRSHLGKASAADRKHLAAISEGDQSAARMARTIANQIAALKKKEHQRRQAATAAHVTHISSGLSGRDRKRVVDAVFHPGEEAEKSPVEKTQEAAEDQDPFANLKANFASAQNQEMKKMTLKKPKTAEPAAAEPAALDVEKDLKAKEAAVIKEAGKDDGVNSKDFVFDVDKDPNGGLQNMEKDALQLATAEDTKTLHEVKVQGEVEAKLRAKKNRQAGKKEVERMPGAGGHLKPPAPQKEETLAEALQGVKQAAEQRDVDEKATRLGELWSEKTHDKKLNSELATEVKVNKVLERARAEKVIEIEDNEESDQLDKINQEFENRFPGTAASSEEEEKPAAVVESESSPEPASAPKMMKAAPRKRRGPVSGWGVLSHELSSEGIQSP